MGKIICFPALSEEQQQRIQQAAPGYTIQFGKAKELDPAELKKQRLYLDGLPLFENMH